MAASMVPPSTSRIPNAVNAVMSTGVAVCGSCEAVFPDMDGSAVYFGAATVTSAGRSTRSASV